MIFNHTGNIGDILYSIPFVVELCEKFNFKLSDVIFNIQINANTNYIFEHPYGNVLMTKDSAEFLKPLLKIIGFKDITISEEKPNDCIALEEFRNKHINTMSGDIRSYYYTLSKIHLPQDFSRKYFNFNFKDEKFNDKIILCISDRYLNPYIDIKALEEFKDNFIFMGLQNEYDEFCSKYFKIQYVKVKNALEAAIVFNSCIGMIGVVGGLFTIAEMMKIPRILITPEFMKLKYKNNKEDKILEKIIKGPVNVLPIGGWFECAKIQNKLINSTKEMISFIKRDKKPVLSSNCNSKIDVWLNDNIFHNKKEGIYIECGANDGRRDSISYFYEKNFDWKGILVEPLEPMMKKCKTCRSDKNIFVNKALSDQNGFLEMEIPEDNLDNASFNMSEKHRETLSKFGMGKTYKKENIEVISYCTMLKEYNIEKIDLAIFDVEGHENHILMDLITSNVLPEIMVVEYDWSDKNELINIVKHKYEVLKEFEHDLILKRLN